MLRINTSYRNRKNVLGRSKAALIKKGTVRASIKEAFKKENKRIRNDRTRLLHEYAPSTKDTSHNSGLYGIGTDRLSLNLPP